MGVRALQEAADKLREALLEYDRTVQEIQGYTRPASEVMTHYVVVAAWSDMGAVEADDDAGPPSSLTHYNSTGMTPWQQKGLLQEEIDILRAQAVVIELDSRDD